MVFCKQCGNPITEGSRFCGICGTMVEESPKAGPAAAPGAFINSLNNTNPHTEQSKMNQINVKTAGIILSIVLLVAGFLSIVALFVPYISGYQGSYSGEYLINHNKSFGTVAGFVFMMVLPFITVLLSLIRKKTAYLIILLLGIYDFVTALTGKSHVVESASEYYSFGAGGILYFMVSIIVVCVGIAGMVLYTKYTRKA